MLSATTARIDRFDKVLQDGAVASMKVLPGGRAPLPIGPRVLPVSESARSSTSFGRSQIRSWWRRRRSPIPTEAQLLCAAAERTVLVAAKGKSRAGDVTAAAEALAKAHAVLLGAVLIEGSNDGQARWRHARRSAAVESLSEPIITPVNLQSSLPEENVLADSRLNRDR